MSPPPRREHIDSPAPATKGDLEELREDVHVDLVNAMSELSEDVQRVEQRLDKKLDLLIDKIDGLIEHRSIELGAAKDEQVQLLDDRVHRLDERVSALE